MTDYEGALGTDHVPREHPQPQPAVPQPAFRFNGYGVPVDDGPPESEPAQDEASPYSYNAYGPAVDPYVDHVPYDEPVVPYAYTEPVEPPAPPPMPPAPVTPEPEPLPVARFEPVVEPPPAPEPAAPDLPRRWELPVARFEPIVEPPPAPEPELRPAPIGSAAYAEQPYVHAYVTADAPVEALARPVPAAWAPPPVRMAPARARTDEPAVVARPAYRPAAHAHAGDRVADETRERTWALVSHIGGLLTGFLVPLVTFLACRKRSQFMREHTTEALNFQLMLAIVYVAGAALTVLYFGVFVLAVAWVFAVTFGTLGALAANDGERFRYPVNLRVIA